MTTTTVDNAAWCMHDLLMERGSMFARCTFFSSDVDAGVMETPRGRRVINLDVDFLQGFREGFEIECGEAADDVLLTCGTHYGATVARQMEEDFGRFYECQVRSLPVAEFLSLMQEHFAQHGWGNVSVDLSMAPAGIIQLEVENPIYGSIVEKTSQPVDALLAGVFAGVFSYFSGSELGCEQTDCCALGHDRARFVLSGRERVESVRDLARSGSGHDAVLSALTSEAQS